MKKINQFLWILALLAFTTPVWAETIAVTKTTDSNDGVCDADCSLREAIVKANSTAELDIIELNQEGPYQITLGRMGIRAELVMKGTSLSPSIIDGNNNGGRRLANIVDTNFVSGSLKKVTFENLVVQNFIDNIGGALNVNGPFVITLLNTSFINNESVGNLSSTGGAIAFKDSALGVATLIVNGGRFENNKALTTSGGALSLEKIVLAINIVELTNSTVFKQNTAVQDGGAVYLKDGIFYGGRIIFDGNQASGQGRGGALALHNSLVLMGLVQFNHNTAFSGGALAFYQNDLCIVDVNCDSPLILSAQAVSFADNQATQGGALYIADMQKGDTLSMDVYLTQASIIDNKAVMGPASEPALGGGIYSNVKVNMAYSTLSQNQVVTTLTADQGGGLFVDGTQDYSLEMKESIFNNNLHVHPATGDAYMDNYAIINPFGDVSLLGHSIVGSDVLVENGSDYSIENDDGMLGDVIILNGYKAGYALRANSPALDAGEGSSCIDLEGHALEADMAGTPMPANGTACDIGAFELNCTPIQYYIDGDGDGYGAGELITTCKASPYAVDNNLDCNDNNNLKLTTTSPELCDDEDNNCNGEYDEGLDTDDADGDGVMNCAETETCEGIDNNNDGAVDEGFGDSDGNTDNGDGCEGDCTLTPVVDSTPDPVVEPTPEDSSDDSDPSDSSDDSEIPDDSDLSDPTEPSDPVAPSETAGGSSGGGCSLTPQHNNFNPALMLMFFPLAGIVLLKRKKGVFYGN